MCIRDRRIHSKSIEEAVCRAMDHLKGAYSLVIMSPSKLIAARDPHGFRPLCIGQLGNSTILSLIHIFTGFTRICEALGGIEMDITEAEKEQINLNVWSQLQIAYENGWDESNLTDANGYLGPNDYGENIHLNGRQALAYARIRKIDSDWERTNRQRKVLVAMMDKMRGTNMLQLLQLGGSLMQYVETNMTLEEIIRCV